MINMYRVILNIPIEVRVKFLIIFLQTAVGYYNILNYSVTISICHKMFNKIPKCFYKIGLSFFLYDVLMKIIVKRLLKVVNFKWPPFCYRTWYYFEKKCFYVHLTKKPTRFDFDILNSSRNKCFF